MNDRPEDHTTNEHPIDPSSADLLGAYLLDAVDDVERRRVERELMSDSALASEAARLRGVVDLLAESAADDDAPAGQWARLEAAISASASVLQTTEASARHRRPTRGGWSRLLLAAAAVAVVFVVGAGLLVQSRGTNDRNGEFAGDPVAEMTALAQQVATQPGSRTAVLTDPGQSMTVDVIVDGSGNAFLMTAALPSLIAGETYQLWSAHGDTMVSLGMLGPDPKMAVVSIDTGVTDLALTREPVGGSVAPSGAPMATGHLV
jgi:anti-sigma-K factor RskA